jgi:hypothetical protein
MRPKTSIVSSSLDVWHASKKNLTEKPKLQVSHVSTTFHICGTEMKLLKLT